MAERCFGAYKNPKNVAVGHPINVNTEWEMEMVKCPHCNQPFAVSTPYLDKINDVVSCPMCCHDVIITPYSEQTQS